MQLKLKGFTYSDKIHNLRKAFMLLNYSNDLFKYKIGLDDIYEQIIAECCLAKNFV